jgi:hypothetical protein
MKPGMDKIINFTSKHTSLSLKIRELNSELRYNDNDLKNELISQGKIDFMNINWRMIHSLISSSNPFDRDVLSDTDADRRPQSSKISKSKI